jgi:uncharacterized protein (TIGR03435 family)
MLLPQASEGGQRGGGGGVDTPPALSALRDALQDQLGLRVEPGEVPSEIVVIDHIERPSEN